MTDIAMDGGIRPTCAACQVKMWLIHVQPDPKHAHPCGLCTFECAVCGAVEALLVDNWNTLEPDRNAADVARL
jgi:hypothetical protein